MEISYNSMQDNVFKIYSLIKDKIIRLLSGDAICPGGEFPALKVANLNALWLSGINGFYKNEKILTLFFRIGIIRSSKECKTNENRIKKIIDEIALKSKDNPDTVANFLLSFCCDDHNGNSAGICAAIPHCNECSITYFCKYWNKRPSLKQLPEVERPRERLIHGGEEQLSDAELLGIIIREGTPKDSAVDVARKLLSKYGDFRLLGSKTIAELCKIEGIGVAKAAQIKATIAIAKRYSTITLKPGTKLSSSFAIFKHYHETLREKKQETFITILLDNKNRMLKEYQISTGSLTSSIVHPREVFGPAIREYAASVVFVHNHPSGDPSPSNEDIEVTQRLKEVSQIVGIKILDHLIIGNNEYVSFKDSGLL